MTIVPETVVAERASVLLSRLSEPTTASACLGLGLALPYVTLTLTLILTLTLTLTPTGQPANPELLIRTRMARRPMAMLSGVTLGLSAS